MIVWPIVNTERTQSACFPVAGSGGGAATVIAECSLGSESRGIDERREHHDLCFVKNIRYNFFGALEEQSADWRGKVYYITNNFFFFFFNSESILL